jgi:hypothetical protein
LEDDRDDGDDDVARRATDITDHFWPVDLRKEQQEKRIIVDSVLPSGKELTVAPQM